MAPPGPPPPLQLSLASKHEYDDLVQRCVAFFLQQCQERPSQALESLVGDRALLPALAQPHLEEMLLGLARNALLYDSRVSTQAAGAGPGRGGRAAPGTVQDGAWASGVGPPSIRARCCGCVLSEVVGSWVASGVLRKGGPGDELGRPPVWEAWQQQPPSSCTV